MNDGMRKVLTEYIGECWHKKQSHIYHPNYCSCGEDYRDFVYLENHIEEYVMDSTIKTGIMHSHNNMGVFFSGTDTDTLLEKATEHSFFTSLIVNNRLDKIAKISYAGKLKTVETFYNRLGNIMLPYSKDVEEDVVFVIDCEVSFENDGCTDLELLDQINDAEEIKVQSFPVDVFPKFIQNFINELNATLNYSRDFLSVACMFSIATVNGNKYKLKVKNGWTASTVFWFAAVGDPGTMKSHPIETMIKPLKLIDKDSKVIYDAEIKIFDANEQKGSKPKFKQMIVSDYTLEALHLIHSINRRGIGLFKDELVGFLNDMNKYRKGSDEQFWLESFNNNSYISNRVSRDPIMIDDLMINILGGIQPAVLSKVVKEFAGNGLIDRFLFTTNETEIYPVNEKDINQEFIDMWQRSIKSLNDHNNYIDSESTITLKLSQDAFDLFIKIDTDLCELQKSDDETHGMKNYISKIKTYVPRFALLMYVFDMLFSGGDFEVNVDQMVRAKKIVDYFIGSAKYVFNEADNRQEIESVTSKMNGQTKVEKIINLHQKGFKNSQISKQLQTPASYVSKILKQVK